MKQDVPPHTHTLQYHTNTNFIKSVLMQGRVKKEEDYDWLLQIPTLLMWKSQWR
jgi:hypothetical protein